MERSVPIAPNTTDPERNRYPPPTENTIASR
jgi:hypothetical protein